ncbi:putative cytochrome P450 hydroxylase [Candidatus Phaeomarinobacter ectocarpi]|uniref:Putative cytochrome P450 hydroxylase n=1 Tax=Candidatus Phaeomarinibacter ectocarpi TaxID=1458461 RepID=X5MLS2_9HYPH|nr:cytochrome P450 [Candidatus Phaeomarinobacter ectocarpi]CDO59720.1 putative cytochrome P450 hydroxylase [Candidatus Phaeomarinobacter ectocarpi]
MTTANQTSPNGAIDVNDIPLAELDVSQPHLFKNDTWRPWFARLRAEAPVHYLADSENGPFWSVTSHDMTKAVDANHKVFSSEEGGIAIVDPQPLDGEQLMRDPSFISMDEPKHATQRKAVSPAVAPKNLAELEPLIRERAADILDNLPVGETFNWVDRVSVELTARMLATLFDFPYERRRDLIRWSDVATAVPKVTGEANDMGARRDALIECATTFYQLWQERAAQPPKFDFVSMLAHGEATKHLSEDPLLMLGNIILLIVGGNDTTRNSISGGVVALNQYPEEYQKLRDTPALIPNMVAETVRWQTPVIHMRRTALEDVELGGKTIRKGDKVVMWYLSGNRDEAVFPDADRLIIDRPNARQHVSFGFGVHRCMGNRLAEMQLRVLWEEIMKRFHTVEVVGEVERLSNNFIRGIASVPVRLHPL